MIGTEIIANNGDVMANTTINIPFNDIFDDIEGLCSSGDYPSHDTGPLKTCPQKSGLLLLDTLPAILGQSLNFKVPCL